MKALALAALLIASSAAAQAQRLQLDFATQAVSAEIPVALSGNCAADLEKPFTVTYKLSGRISPVELKEKLLTGAWEPNQNAWRAKLAAVRAEEAAVESLKRLTSSIVAQGGAASRRWNPILLSFDIPERSSNIVYNGTLATGGLEYRTVVRLNFIALSEDCSERLVQALDQVDRSREKTPLPEGFKRVATYLPLRDEGRLHYVRPDGDAVKACLAQLEKRVTYSYWVGELLSTQFAGFGSSYFGGRLPELALTELNEVTARFTESLKGVSRTDLVVIPVSHRVREELLGDTYFNARRNQRLGVRNLGIAEAEFVVINGDCSSMVTQVRDRLEELRRATGIDSRRLVAKPRPAAAEVPVIEL